MGVAYLPDTSVDVYPDIRISGVDLEERFYKKFSRAQMEEGYLEKRLGKAHTEKFQILLAHFFGCLCGMGGRSCLKWSFPWRDHTDSWTWRIDDTAVSVF